MADDDLERRLTDLEARYAFLDDLVGQLESLVTAQQRTLDSLREELLQTRETLRNLDQDGQGAQPEPPPPHY